MAGPELDRAAVPKEEPKNEIDHSVNIEMTSSQSELPPNRFELELEFIQCLASPGALDRALSQR